VQNPVSAAVASSATEPLASDGSEIAGTGARNSSGSLGGHATLTLRITYRPLHVSETLPLDVYGFEVPLQHVIAFRDVRRSTARDGTMWLHRWNKIMRQSTAASPLPAEAASLARSLYGRVPLQHRPHLWLSLTGAREMMRQSRLTYWEIAQTSEKVSVDPAIIKQIDSDLPRTFPGHMGFALPSTGLRAALRRVLVAYASYNVSVGYCQSLNFIAAVFLLVADEEGAFWLLAALCRSVVPDYHTHYMSGLRVDTALFASLVANTLPSLYARFCDLEVPIEILASQWWLCLYANVLPTATLLRTWDVVLSGGGVDTLVASALAILRRYASRLSEAEDIAGVYAVLAEATPALWDPDELLLTMQQTMTALDASGSKRQGLQREREERRTAQLEQAVAESAFTPADLASLLRALLHDASTAAPLQLATSAAGSTPHAATVVDVANAAASAPAAEPAAVLCATCLERHLGPRELAALLTPGAHLTTLGLRVRQAGAPAAAGAASAAGATETEGTALSHWKAVERLFALLEGEPTVGLLSTRHLITAFSGPPSDELASCLLTLGLESSR